MELSDLIKNDDGSYTFPFDTKTSVHSSHQKLISFRVKGECWECCSHHQIQAGHCQMERNGKSILVHRYVYENVCGDIPDGLIVRHTCDNPKCINPNHLLVGTYKDNCRDMFDRHRDNRPKGERHHKHILSENQVLEAYHSSEPARVFAEKFGCHISTIHYIRNGKLWGWLTGGGMSAV